MIFYKNTLLKRVRPDSHINYIVLSDCQTHISQKLRQFRYVLLEPSSPSPHCLSSQLHQAGFLNGYNLVGENAQILTMTQKSVCK